MTPLTATSSVQPGSSPPLSGMGSTGHIYTQQRSLERRELLQLVLMGCTVEELQLWSPPGAPASIQPLLFDHPWALASLSVCLELA